MQEHGTFRVNSPKVIHETIDGEVIIVNLDSGSYYSLQKAGADLWRWLSAGANVAQASELLGAHYDANGTDLAAVVGQLVSELQAEQLLLPVEGGHAASLAMEPPATKQRFEMPALGKYTDMQELLVLDPIHEVDDAGWPVARTNPPNEK